MGHSWTLLIFLDDAHRFLFAYSVSVFNVFKYSNLSSPILFTSTFTAMIQLYAADIHTVYTPTKMLFFFLPFPSSYFIHLLHNHISKPCNFLLSFLLSMFHITSHSKYKIYLISLSAESESLFKWEILSPIQKLPYPQMPSFLFLPNKKNSFVF